MVLLDISFPETCLDCPLRVGFTCAPVQGDSHLNRARLGGTERPEWCPIKADVGQVEVGRK